MPKKINIQMGADVAFIKVHSTHTQKSILHTAEFNLSSSSYSILEIILSTLLVSG